MFDNDNWGEFAALRGWHGHRAKRGDMKPIIIRMLKDKPMHGYEIISRLEERSHGMWRPSAGSVYPNLQLMEEEELVTSQVQDGKKVYSLTAKGEKEAESVEEDIKAPWEEKSAHARHFKDLRMTAMEMMHILRQIALQNSEKKNEEVKQILQDTKQKLEELAQED